MTANRPDQINPGPQRQAIEQEAARLFHMARDSGAGEDWAQVYRWIEQSPAHGVAFARVEAGWEAVEALRSKEHAQEDAVPEPAITTRMSRRAFGALAAGSGIAATITLALWHFGTRESYSTKVGEARMIRLADGSRVQLNTDSEIDVSLQKERRQIRFLKGEARFDVARDPARPFLVTARDGSLQAMGTVFNLRQRKDFTELTVLEGKVAVIDDGATTASVPAGTAAMIRAATVSVIRLAPDDLERRTAWQQGQIHLEGETLSQAVDEFNRYRTRPLVIGDPDLAGLRMGGMFSARNSDDFVEALKQSFGIRIMEGNDGAVILLPQGDLGNRGQKSA